MLRSCRSAPLPTLQAIATDREPLVERFLETIISNDRIQTLSPSDAINICHQYCLVPAFRSSSRLRISVQRSGTPSSMTPP